MDKKSLIGLKSKVLSLALATALGTTGCGNVQKNVDGIAVVEIPSDYSHPEKFYKYVVQGSEAIKKYDSNNVYLYFDKETYEVKEFLFAYRFSFLGDGYGGEFYELPSEELVAYSDGIQTSFNKKYYSYITDNNYEIHLTDIEDYIEGISLNDYYSLDEIRELEPQLVEALKLINEEKGATLSIKPE